jgi:K+-H+ exchange-related protein
MDVYLIPTAAADQYELYYEAEGPETAEGADAKGDGGPAADGIVQRVRRRFSEMLHEAEEWRLRRHEQEEEQGERASFMTRMRRRMLGFVVERIAEQRLLWHLRTATEVCAQVPGDLSVAAADTIIRATLKKDLDHHFKWLWIDLALLVLVAPLVVIPGPNVPGFYFTFQVVGHFLSYRGAKHGLSGARWIIKPNAALSELRSLLTPSTPHRTRRVQEVAARLRLQHLATYFEQVAGA